MSRTAFDLSIAGLGITCGVVVLLVDLLGSPPPSLSDIGLGPTAIPNVIAVVILALSLLLIGQAARHQPVPADANAAEESGWAEVVHLCRLTLLFALYVVALWALGFVAATVLFLLVFYRLVGATGWSKSAVIAVVFSLAVYYVFERIFAVQLPAGIFWEV